MHAIIPFLIPVTITFDFILATIILFFTRSISWSDHKNRPSIVGFMAMVAVYILNIVLLACK